VRHGRLPASNDVNRLPTGIDGSSATLCGVVRWGPANTPAASGSRRPPAVPRHQRPSIRRYPEQPFTSVNDSGNACRVHAAARVCNAVYGRVTPPDGQPFDGTTVMPTPVRSQTSRSAAVSVNQMPPARHDAGANRWRQSPYANRRLAKLLMCQRCERSSARRHDCPIFSTQYSPVHANRPACSRDPGAVVRRYGGAGNRTRTSAEFSAFAVLQYANNIFSRPFA